MAVYFIQAGDLGPIKIGFSSNPLKRMEALEKHAVAPLRPLIAINGLGIKEEKKFHRKFKRHRLHGEWFKPHPDIFNFISKLENQEGAFVPIDFQKERRKPPKRKSFPKNVHFRVDEETYDYLEKLRAAKCIDMGAWFRAAVREKSKETDVLLKKMKRFG